MGILDFESQVFLAPMAGITDKPMRKLVHSFGGGNIVSEMVAINALERKNPKTSRIADVRDEPYPVIVQLVGYDDVMFADSAKLAAELGAHGIDINMGCPVKKIVNNNSGAYLSRDLAQASKIISSVVKATPLKVSVKFRLGWDHDHINAVEFAKMCEDSGASYITVHGRTRSDFYSGVADWNAIAQVKLSVKIPVIGNGDIVDGPSAAAMIKQTGVDAVMVGRATLGAPWLISQIDCYLKGKTFSPTITIEQIKSTLLTHIKELRDYYGDRTALALSRKYVCWYCKGLRDAKRFREQYVKTSDFDSAFSVIDDYFNFVGEDEK
ncbi:MAG: tRNA dihydrouridine synthase DusB [Alphaproteobacteria bacterium]|nr:tRNA dihydrouridine synthase DusB [Alphaproteobacteria bacterium]